MNDFSLSSELPLNETRRYPPPQHIIKRAHFDAEAYAKLYRASLETPEAFWLEQANTLDWIKYPTIACQYQWNSQANQIEHKWFEDGLLNVSYNCLDRHLTTNPQKVALIWQGEEIAASTTYTYAELHEQVCRFANVLKSQGIQKGDRVCIYLPMIPELAIVMLACARIGAIHSIVFGGFSAESLAHRIQDSECRLLITATVSMHGGKRFYLKNISDEALQTCASIEKVIVIQRNEDLCSMQAGRDLWYHNLMVHANPDCPPEAMQANDPLFILYTSGSTGKPKGIVHGQGGYLLYSSLTHRYAFDIHQDDVYWCTADIGWITGHSYAIYGPLANGVTTLLYESTPTYPHPGRFWEIIDKYRVTVFYTAPTVIRSLIKTGTEHPRKYNLDSLRILGTVGEPINPETWIWYYQEIGHESCPVIDTWWQTETGGIMITALPGAHDTKPGSAGRPFFGIEPAILRDDGSEAPDLMGGSLCIRKPWPGIMLTTWGDHQQFISTYFSKFPDIYFSGDGACRDLDGDYWLLGRIDDVVNISGHRIGTAEVESAIVSFPSVAEAAIVPIPHPIKGQGLYAYIILKEGTPESEILKEQIKNQIRLSIGAIAIPDVIQFVQALPKTRSGKIMRRVLKKIAENKLDELGDVSTLADPQVIAQLLMVK